MKKIIRFILKMEMIDVTLATSLMTALMIFIIHQQTVYLGFFFLVFAAVVFWMKFGYEKISSWTKEDEK